MKTVKTITAPVDVCALVEHFCRHGRFEMCEKHEIELFRASANSAPKWVVPVTLFDDYSEPVKKYFVFDHEFCALSVQDNAPVIRKVSENQPVGKRTSPYHHWDILEGPCGEKIVETTFNIPKTSDPVVLPDHISNRCFFENSTNCPVLFLTDSDVTDAFPFRDIVSDLKNIELKVTRYGEPVWLVTKNRKKRYVIYPLALHRFVDEPDVTHNFDGELRDPMQNEEFLVYHYVADVYCPLILLKVKSQNELSILPFGKLKKYLE